MQEGLQTWLIPLRLYLVTWHLEREVQQKLRVLAALGWGKRGRGPLPASGGAQAESVELSMCTCPARIGRLIKDPTDAPLPPSTSHMQCLWLALHREGSPGKHSPTLWTWWPCSRTTTQNLSFISTQSWLWKHSAMQLCLRFFAALCLQVWLDSLHT